MQRDRDNRFDSVMQQLSSILQSSANGMTVVEAMLLGEKAHTALGILDGRLDVESSKIVLSAGEEVKS